MEEKTKDQLIEEFKAKISKHKSKVEQKMLSSSKDLTSEIAEDLTIAREIEIAKNLVELQNRQGGFSRKDIAPADANYIAGLASKLNCSFEDAIAHFVTNCQYNSPDNIEVNNICELIYEIFEVKEKYYDKINAFPINLLSQKSRDYLVNKKIKITIDEKFKAFLEVYLPELSGMNITTKSYELKPQYRHHFDEQTIDGWLNEINKIKTADNNIDILFNNETLINEIVASLSERGKSFEEFMSSFGFNWSKCYGVDAIAVFDIMLETFKRKNGNSYRGISKKDPYLKNKLDAVRINMGFSSVAEMLEYFEKKHDLFNNGQVLTDLEIEMRIKSIKNYLETCFPDHVIDESFSTKHKEIYVRACFLALRLKHRGVDSFLASIGFKRQRFAQDTSKPGRIDLSIEDFLKYEFISEDKKRNEEIIEQYNIQELPVNQNLTTYKRLIGKQCDSRRIVNFSEEGLY